MRYRPGVDSESGVGTVLVVDDHGVGLANAG
jgi:hypothetical protein